MPLANPPGNYYSIGKNEAVDKGKERMNSICRYYGGAGGLNMRRSKDGITIGPKETMEATPTTIGITMVERYCDGSGSSGSCTEEMWC